MSHATAIDVLHGRANWAVDVGDTRRWLKTLPSDSVHCIVTSPPYYGLRSYVADDSGLKNQELGAEETPEQYVANMTEVFRECRRVLRPDGLLWLNLGDSYWNHSPVRVSSAGAFEKVYTGGKISEGSRRRANGHPTLKMKDLIGIPWMTAFALRADGWYLRQWLPWVKRNCLSGQTMLYARTQGGDAPSTLKDLVRLDPSTVQLWNGQKWTRVVSWYRNDEPDEPLEVEFRNGQVVKCTSNHLWPTQRGVIRAAEVVVGDVVPVVRLPQPAAPEAPDMLPDTVGWFVGLYLAEGSLSGDTIQIACHHDEVAEWGPWLTRLAEKYGGTCRSHFKEGKSATINLNCRVLLAVLQMYLTGRTSHDKRLASASWRRGDGFIGHLLSGYLEGDGHWEERNGRWRLGFCRNDGLASDIRTMAARVGASVRIKPHHGKGFRGADVDTPKYRGSLRWERPDRSVNTGNFQHAEDGEVVAIRAARWAGSFYDVEVADDPHTFALASGILTHNCMPESAEDRPSTACETVFLFAKSADPYFDMEAVKVPVVNPTRVRKDRVGGNKINATKHSDGSEYEQGETRNFRSGDLWFESVGLLIHDGQLLGFDVPVRGRKEAHFAIMSDRLAEPMILAGTSAKGVCPECGAPWTRVVEKERVATRPGNDTKVGRASSHDDSPYQDHTIAGNRDPQRHVTKTKTVGWEPGCKCGCLDTVPAIVLDPFMGSGTTAAVAVSRGRCAVGVELNPTHAEIARKRIAAVPTGFF